jgi:hypothetical protein
MRRVFLAAALAGALALSACATVTAVSGPYKAGDAYTVTLARQWSDISAIMPQRPRNVRLISIDGPFLNRVYVAGGLTPGQYLVKPARRETPTPTFRADMSETELVEFVTDSIAALDYQRPEALNLRPANFGSAPGLRFDVSAQTKEGLNISGDALLARVGDRVHLLLYLAPSEHYYERNHADVEAIFTSVALR